MTALAKSEISHITHYLVIFLCVTAKIQVINQMSVANKMQMKLELLQVQHVAIVILRHSCFTVKGWLLAGQVYIPSYCIK